MDIAQESARGFSPAPGFFKRLTVLDWLYAAALLGGALFALNRYGSYMDVYEKAILLLSAPVFAWLGWNWRAAQALMAGLALLSLGAIALYDGSLAAANTKFLLKYLLSSQSAILWMSTLFFLSTLFYVGGLALRSETGGSIGNKL